MQIKECTLHRLIMAFVLLFSVHFLQLIFSKICIMCKCFCTVQTILPLLRAHTHAQAFVHTQHAVHIHTGKQRAHVHNTRTPMYKTAFTHLAPMPYSMRWMDHDNSSLVPD